MIIKKIKGEGLFTVGVIVLLFCFIVTCTAVFGDAGSPGKQDRVKTGDFVKTIVLTGSLKAQKSEPFVVPVTNTWRIQIKWMVKEGEDVNPGDTVVRFDTSTLGTDIENLENSLQVKNEQQEQRIADYYHQKFELEVKLKQVEIDYKKAQIDASIPPGVEAKYEYDQKQLELKKKEQALKDTRVEKEVRLAALDSDIKTLKIEILEEEAKLEKYKTMLKDMSLIAKTAGTMVYEKMRWQERKIEIGDTVFSSMPIAYIPDNESLQVEAWVHENDIHHIRPGQKVQLILDAYPQRQFAGTIRVILNSAEDKRHWGRATYFRTNIHLESRNSEIMKPGMSAKCIVQAAAYPEVLLVPLQMTHFDGLDFWLKVKGREVIKVNPLGFNEFHLALPVDSYKHITNETPLQRVVPGTEKSSEKD
jgi:multidrug efflux pump subunit AcrA (membrane-fusion protein)